ncbi:HlyD family secretion protein [Hydrogenophaga pseudoflava]|uniref:HlyD family secretion protein n=1 Tax=Hydrogenophaga pseudoflava TaxID=47421 RepID=UPI0027E44C05|nr:HlyD family efflux transporter periplasmic adaptor subunit [Hydrogenophaga pseudoflava]MDQ7742765.1 HlyD family efflux transporter periplasmic adaptor subunit [Hydrogenophaga pseudoflava]
MKRWDVVGVLVLLVSGCGQPAATGWSGYAEGDFVYIAAPLAGRLDRLAVRAGDVVRQGDALFALDAVAEQAAVAEAQARAKATDAQAQNIGKGRRPDELAVVQAQLTQARAQAVLAKTAWQRQKELVDKGFVSAAQLDTAAATLRQAEGRVAELESALRVAKLPARSDEREAAEASAASAREAVRQGEWRVAQKQQAAPADAQVAEVFFRAGEYVGAGQPVLSLLPPGAVKALFYVPEAELAGLALGQAVRLSCDGCGDPVPARISRIATAPEFTPPVIYSNAQRARLVYRVEARPEAGAAARLHPGQPLDVRPTPKAAP